MKMMVDTTSGLFSDGKYWYRPVIRDGTMVLERVDGSEALNDHAEGVKSHDEVSA